MHGLHRSILAACLLGPLLGIDAAGQDASPRQEPRSADAPIYVLIEGEKALEALRNRIDRPDFVLLKGDRYDELKRLAQPPPATAPMRSVVESVILSGEILADQASLTFDLEILLTGKDPAWVPIRLDGKIPTSAREGDRELAMRQVEGVWQVKLDGEGLHRVKVGLTSRVMPAPGSPEGRRMEWAIPEAATTRVQLLMSPDATEVEASGQGGTHEPILIEPVEGGQRIRASASLPPQRKLELSWRVAEKSPVAGPPLLMAQGEIAIEVERGTIRTRSAWVVRSERGTVRQLSLRLEQGEELVGLEADGKPMLVEGPADPNTGAIVVPLGEPLRPGEAAKLILSTRRATSTESTARVNYRGVPFKGISGQAGVIAISQRGTDIWVSAVPGRGVKQIDPRNDLPATLRAKPSIVLAYQFAEQSFDLSLQVDPSPPWVQVKSRTTITLNPGRAWVDTWLDYTVPRGRIFEARVALPEELILDFKLIGPQANVESAEILNATSQPARSRILVARLTNRASENGFFAIHLSGWQNISSEGELRVGLPSPLDAQSRGGLIALVADRGLSIETGDNSNDPGEGFHRDSIEPPASWAWPTDRPVVKVSPAIWLRHEENPRSLPLKIVPRLRTVQESTTIEARISPRRLDARQTTALQVEHGVLDFVDVVIPKQIDGAWEAEGADFRRSELVGTEADGAKRYRLTLSRGVADRCLLAFRIGQTMATALDGANMQPLTIPRVRVIDTQADLPRYRVGAEDRVELQPVGDGWATVPAEDQLSTLDFAGTYRLERTGDGPAQVLARANPVALLPRLVISRLAIISTLGAAGGVRTSASYRVESHDGALIASLPSGARWERATVGGEVISEIESIDGPGNAYRIKITTGSPTPIVVTLDYVQPVKPGDAWTGPRLLDGGVVQECYWEVRLPWNVALIGVPTGWSDANHWRWSLYAFIREPRVSSGQLAAWVGPTVPTARPMDSGSLHSYLFARVGKPSDLKVHIVSRASLVGSCSGIVMLVGLTLLLFRGWGRVAWFVLPIAGVLIAALVPWNLILVFFQSSLVGFLLIGASALTQSIVEGRAPVVRGYDEPREIRPASTSASGQGVNQGVVAPEESTVIRARPGTTIDHSPAIVPVPEGSHPG